MSTSEHGDVCLIDEEHMNMTPMNDLSLEPFEIIGERGTNEIHSIEDGEKSGDEEEHENLLLIDIGVHSDEDDEELNNAREHIINYNRLCKTGDKRLGEVEIETCFENGLEKQEDETVTIEHAQVLETEATLVLEKNGSQSVAKRRVQYSDDDDDSSSTHSNSEDELLSEFKELSDDEFGNQPNEKFEMYDPDKPFLRWSKNVGFIGPTQFKECVRRYSIEKRLALHIKRNNKKVVEVICLGAKKKCKWRVWASWSKPKMQGTFVVKKLRRKHLCGHTATNTLVTGNILANMFRDFIVRTPKLSASALHLHIKDVMKLEVSLSSCKRLKKKIHKEMVEKHLAEFAEIYNYAAEIRRSNPGSTVEIQTITPELSEKSHFRRMYVCFDAVKKGFLAGCRPFIGLDGCFLKGVLKGELLTAIGKDANNQMYPIAWAIVEVECMSSWMWFLDLIKKDLNITTGHGWTFMSDRQKGLINAIQDLCPESEQRMCCRHLYANWRKNHAGKDLKIEYWRIAKATCMPDYNAQVTTMCEISALGCTDIIDQCHPKYRCRAFFQLFSQVDSVENNCCESFNATIIQARGKSVISMLEEIREYVMKRLASKNEDVNKWTLNYGHRIRRRLNESYSYSIDWEVIHNGKNGYEVKKKNNKEKHVVRVTENSCTCRRWQLSGIPCAHAVKALQHDGNDPADYISHYLTKEAYVRSYTHMIEPVLGMSFWEQTRDVPCLPPVTRKLPGRPRTKRIKEVGDTLGKKIQYKEKVGTNLDGSMTSVEDTNTNGGTTATVKPKKQMTCSLCKSLGHNRRGCRTTQQSTRIVQEIPSCSSQSGLSKLSASEKHHKHSQQMQTARSQQNRSQHKFEGYGIYQNSNTGVAILNPGHYTQHLVNDGAKDKKRRVDPSWRDSSLENNERR